MREAGCEIGFDPSLVLFLHLPASEARGRKGLAWLFSLILEN